MNKPKVTSRIWKDDRHVKGSEFSQEIKNVSAFNSYHRNPKQAFRKGKKRSQNVASDRTILLYEMERGLRADGYYHGQNWVTDSTIIVPKPKAEFIPNKSHDSEYWINRIANAV